MKRLFRLSILMLLSGFGPLVSAAQGQLLTMPLSGLPENQEMFVSEINLAPGQP